MSVNEDLLATEKVLSIAEKERAKKIVNKLADGELLQPIEKAWVNHEGIREYIEQVLDNNGLGDEVLAQALKRIVDAGSTGEALKYVKPMVALQGIRTAFELRDRFPATKIEAKTLSVDMQFKGLGIDDLQKMLTSIRERSDKFMSAISKKK